MIPNREERHYLVVSKLSALLRRITSKHIVISIAQIIFICIEQAAHLSCIKENV